MQERGFEFVEALGKELSAGQLVLPSFPDVAVRVQKALEDPEVDINKVVQLANSEPILTARLLRMANSALLKRGSAQVTDLRMAVMRLGFDMVKNAAISLAMEQILQAKSMGRLKPYLEELWQHSIQVSAIAYALTKKCTKLNPDEAMLGGLLHDIGKYYILMRSEKYPELFSDAQALRDIMQDWHTGIGHAILEAWGFGESIAMAADEHESLDREHLGPPDLIDVVMVANLLTHQEQDGPYKDVEWGEVPAFAKLKLDLETSKAILEESREEIASLSSALGS